VVLTNSAVPASGRRALKGAAEEAPNLSPKELLHKEHAARNGIGAFSEHGGDIGATEVLNFRHDADLTLVTIIRFPENKGKSSKPIVRGELTKYC